MTLPIAETTGPKLFKSGHLQIALYTLNYGTHREALACFPNAFVDSVSLPAGELDATMAVKAIGVAYQQGDVARGEIDALAMWDTDAEGLVPHVIESSEEDQDTHDEDQVCHVCGGYGECGSNLSTCKACNGTGLPEWKRAES